LQKFQVFFSVGLICQLCRYPHAWGRKRTRNGCIEQQNRRRWFHRWRHRKSDRSTWCVL